MGQLGTSVNVHQGASQHAQLADPVVTQGADRSQAHEQVHQEKRKDGDQPQREQVQRAIFGHAVIDGLEPVTKAPLNGIAQHVA